MSIAIIAYRQQEYIGEAIESALAQDWPSLEVVVADDASPDRTADVIRDFAARDGRVVPVLAERNLGITGNSNAALKACTGDYIAFLGGDDVLLPGKITAQVGWLEADRNRVLCGHHVEVFYEDRSRPPHLLNPSSVRCGRGARGFIRDLPFGATSVMVRADAIPSSGFDARMPVMSDQMMWVDVVGEHGAWGYVDGVYARYRRHSANVTNEPHRYREDVQTYLDIVRSRFPALTKEVDRAVTRRLYYDVGVALLEAQRPIDARRSFVSALAREPTFFKAGIRWIQSFVAR